MTLFFAMNLGFVWGSQVAVASTTHGGSSKKSLLKKQRRRYGRGTR